MAIRLTRHEEFAHITLDRPQALNALSFALIRELDACLAEVERSDARALLITGALTEASTIEMLKIAFPVPPELVALTDTMEFPAVVGVPEIRPVVELTLKPAGKPDAPNEVGLLLAAIW